MKTKLFKIGYDYGEKSSIPLQHVIVKAISENSARDFISEMFCNAEFYYCDEIGINLNETKTSFLVPPQNT